MSHKKLVRRTRKTERKASRRRNLVMAENFRRRRRGESTWRLKFSASIRFAA